MPELHFEGHSDDTFGEYNHISDDFDCCANGAMIVWRVTAGDEGLHVCGQYDGNGWPSDSPGCWIIGVQQMDEGAAIPRWPMRFENSDAGYSPRLVIEAPEGVSIECLNLADK